MPIDYRTDARYGRLNREQVRRHYDAERMLRKRLLASPPVNRAETFLWAYDELFRLCPWHPALSETSGAEAAELVERRARDMEPLLGCAPGARVLEIGCGMGELMIGLARRGYDATGVDISRERIERLRGHEDEHLRFVRTEGTRFPFADCDFDAIVSMQLFEHLHPDDAAIHLREALRLLKPGGRYLLETPNKWVGPGDVSRFFSDQPEGFHFREYGVGELTKLFRSAGYDSVEVILRRSRMTSAWKASALELGWRMLPRSVRRRRSFGLNNPIYVGYKAERVGEESVVGAASAIKRLM